MCSFGQRQESVERLMLCGSNADLPSLAPIRRPRLASPGHPPTRDCLTCLFEQRRASVERLMLCGSDDDLPSPRFSRPPRLNDLSTLTQNLGHNLVLTVFFVRDSLGSGYDATTEKTDRQTKEKQKSLNPTSLKQRQESVERLMLCGSDDDLPSPSPIRRARLTSPGHPPTRDTIDKVYYPSTREIRKKVSSPDTSPRKLYPQP